MDPEISSKKAPNEHLLNTQMLGRGILKFATGGSMIS